MKLKKDKQNKLEVSTLSSYNILSKLINKGYVMKNYNPLVNCSLLTSSKTL